MAEAFFMALTEERFADASQFVFADDRKSFDEARHLFETLKASISHEVHVEFDDLRTQGKAKCEAQIDVGQLQFSGAGEKPTSMKQSFTAGLEYIDGRWWIRI